MSTQPENLYETTGRDPDATAVEDDARSYTYREVELRGRRLANLLASKGLGLDGRWALLSGNRVEWAEAQPDTLLPDVSVGSPLLFTGGTTGRSKGVNRSDANFDVSVAPTIFASRAFGVPDTGVCLMTTPLYHAMGFGVLRAVLSKDHRVVLHDRFDPELTLATIEAQRVTSMFLVPTQFIRLLKLPEAVRARYDVSSVEWIIHTAAPCPSWVKRGMIDWFGPVVNELYGSSEGLGPVTCTSEEWLAHPGTVGRPNPNLELFIVDEDGNDLPPGEVGTIYGRRADGAPEYDGDPEKTAANRLPDGRFTVGDLGWLDVHAVVEPAEGLGVDEVDSVTLQEFVRDRLSTMKVPRSIDVIGSLPREAHGKLKKRLLRDPYWADVAHAT